MISSAQSLKLIQQLVTAPELAIEKLNLQYINNDKLTIYRKAKGKEFYYLLNDQPIQEKDHLERIKALVIPPAWNNVRISALDNGHLQAVGRDLKNRKQYRYHPLWNKIRNQTKFYKMASFGEILPQIRARIDQDLELPGMSKNKVLALIIRIMEETHIRIGNEYYARRNKTYGLTTMRTRHLHLSKNNLQFEFVGKKGKEHKISLQNKKLIHLVNRCEELPGWELFQYIDEEGNKHSVESGMVNEYLHQISGDMFTAKDFRTWAATIIFFDTVMELGIQQDTKEIHKNVLVGFDAAAKALGNTRNVCRKYYVHPYIVSSYEDGSIQDIFDQVHSTSASQENFSPSEAGVLVMLKEYLPNFLKNAI